jgi:hypothetical protein
VRTAHLGSQILSHRIPAYTFDKAAVSIEAHDAF